MGNKRFGRKRGFKARKNSEEMKSHGRKFRRNGYEKRLQTSVPNDSGEESSEEHPSVASDEEHEEEVEVYREPSMYENLLKMLGSGSESVANAYKRRLREEEGNSDSDDDMEDNSEASSAPEEEEDGNGSDSQAKAEQTNLGEPIEDDGNDEDDNNDAFEIDEYDESTEDGLLMAQTSASKSSFNNHLGYQISKEEVENLLQRKWRYKKEVYMNLKWISTGEIPSEDLVADSCYGLKPKLYKHWLDMYKASGGSDFHSSKQRSFFSLCNSYRDILHHNKKPFYLKGVEEDSNILDAYVAHSLNHVFRTGSLVSKNDSKLGKHQETGNEELLSSDTFLDHGFTRPKVLILLPLASIALRVVKRIIQLTPSTNKVSVEKIVRFSEEFGSGGFQDHEDEDVDDSNSHTKSKPADFQALFGGNNNDLFMIGIKFTRKSIRLYSDFYTSDIIVASPLGLIKKIGEAEADKEKDVDYLSSIEVLIIDHADVIVMQNWSHVNTVVEHLNRLPSKPHGTDIMRIRQWYLDGQAQFYRQTIILGGFVNPDINALFNNHCLNYRGKVKLLCEHKGVLSNVLLQVRQIYERFETESIVDADDARFEYFSKKVFPKIKDTVQGGIMLFISSYFEFVRVRNFLKSQEASFCQLQEYTEQSDISRARVWFFHGKRKIMLYTERAHFYHRYMIRGIQNLIIYSLPERKELYPEIVNMLDGSQSMNCTVLFSRFDLLRLARIVGTSSAEKMVASDKDVFIAT